MMPVIIGSNKNSQLQNKYDQVKDQNGQYEQ